MNNENARPKKMQPHFSKSHICFICCQSNSKSAVKARTTNFLQKRTVKHMKNAEEKPFKATENFIKILISCECFFFMLMSCVGLEAFLYSHTTFETVSGAELET